MKWELQKLKHGINSKWAIQARHKQVYDKEKEKNIFEIFNTIKLRPVQISDVMNKAEEDLIHTEVFI